MNTQQLQSLIDSTITQTVMISETVELTDYSTVNLKGKIIQSSAEPSFRIMGKFWTLTSGKIISQVGLVFDCLSSQSGLMLNVSAATVMRSKEVFRCIQDSSCYDTHIIGGEWQKPQEMLTPIILVDSNGPFFNSNSFSKMRFQTNGKAGAPCIRLACGHLSNYLYGNAIQDCNFEIPNGGAIHLQSCFGTTITNPYMFDCDLFGPITDHLIYSGRLAANKLKSKQTTITNYFRLSGSLNVDKYDIYAPSLDHQSSLILTGVDSIDGALARIHVPKESVPFQRAVYVQQTTS